MSEPFVAFGNEELAGKPPLKAGDLVTCHRCKKRHKVKGSTDLRTGKPGCLLSYKCGKDSYIAGIAGKSVM